MQDVLGAALVTHTDLSPDNLWRQVQADTALRLAILHCKGKQEAVLKERDGEQFVFFCRDGSYNYYVVWRWWTLADTRQTSTPMLSVNLIFHPSSGTAAAPALSSAGLIDVIVHKAALLLHTWHVLVIVALGVMGRCTGVLRHDVWWHAAVQRGGRKLGDVAEGIRSLHGARWRRCRHPLYWTAGIALRVLLSPEYERHDIDEQ